MWITKKKIKLFDENKKASANSLEFIFGTIYIPV